MAEDPQGAKNRDSPWVSLEPVDGSTRTVRRDNLESLDVLELGVDSARAVGQVEGDVVHPDPIKPALEHCRLAAEPSRIHQHDPLTPLQRLKVMSVGWPVFGVAEVVESFLGRKCGVEMFGVEIEDSDLAASRL